MCFVDFTFVIFKYIPQSDWYACVAAVGKVWFSPSKYVPYVRPYCQCVTRGTYEGVQFVVVVSG